MKLQALTQREQTLSIKWNRYARKDLIVLGTADMDFKSPDCIRDALLNKAASGSYAYEMKPESYFQAIIDWYGQEYQWPIQPEWLTNSPGMWALFYLCLQAFTDAGDGVLVHAPHFHPAITAIQGSQRRVVTQAMVCQSGETIFDADEFEKCIKTQRVKLFFLVNPHNPTGKVFTRDELGQIARICDRYGVVVISDEIHGLITFDGVTFVPYGSVSPLAQSHSVTLASPSKAFNIQGLTYAIGIVSDPALRQQLETVRTWYDFDFASNIFSVAAVAAAYQQGKPWLNELNNYLQGNLDALCAFCADKIPHLRVVRPQGGYMAWLDFRAFNFSPEALQQRLLNDAKVGLTWGESFGEEGWGYERLNFGCPRPVLDEGLRRIADAFR